MKEPLKQLASINDEKRKSLKQAIKQLRSFLKESEARLNSKDPSFSVNDFSAQYCLQAENLKRVATELGSSEQIEFVLMRHENLTSKIMR